MRKIISKICIATLLALLCLFANTQNVVAQGKAGMASGSKAGLIYSPQMEAPNHDFKERYLSNMRGLDTVIKYVRMNDTVFGIARSDDGNGRAVFFIVNIVTGIAYHVILDSSIEVSESDIRFFNFYRVGNVPRFAGYSQNRFLVRLRSLYGTREIHKLYEIRWSGHVRNGKSELVSRSISADDTKGLGLIGGAMTEIKYDRKSRRGGPIHLTLALQKSEIDKVCTTQLQPAKSMIRGD